MAEKIRKGFISVVWIVLIGAVIIAIYTRKDQPAPTAPAALALQASPQPSETPTPIATSTPNATATRQAEELSIKAWEADIAVKNAQAAALELDNQRKAGEIIAQYDWTPTAIARMTERAEKTAEAEASAKAIYIEQENARIMAAIETDKRKAENAAWLDLIVKSAAAIIITALIVGMIIVLTYRVNLSAWRKAAEGTSDNLLENLERPSEVSPALNDLPAYPGGLDTRLFAAFLSPGTLRKAAGLVVAGTPLIHDNFTPIANCMSEGQFARLQAALVEYRAATWNDETHKAGITLTEKGIKFFADLQTASPFNQDAPKTTPPALKRSIDDGFQPIGEGGKEG